MIEPEKVEKEAPFQGMLGPRDTRILDAYW